MPLSRVAFTSVWAYSSAWLERFPDKEEVGGSSPPRPTIDAVLVYEDYSKTITIRCSANNGDLAQLVEHRLCKAGVRGSIPLVSTYKLPANFGWRVFIARN